MNNGAIEYWETGAPVYGEKSYSRALGRRSGPDGMLERVSSSEECYSIIHDYHFGGYAKANPELFLFMNQFFDETTIPTDFVYTGKLFYAVEHLIKQNYFPRGANILVIHSGGLQGNASLPNGKLIF